ncbi:MAG: YjbQ family protein [Acidobacteria bacterium]|nr:YjbQ family protein [Acidobacteriota bacterium]
MVHFREQPPPEPHEMRLEISTPPSSAPLEFALSPGSTAGVTTVEFEPGLVRDLNEFFEKLIPERREYFHHATWGDDNGSSHLRAALLKPSLTIPFKNGQLLTGTWQQVVLIDFDTRPRQRSIVFQFMGE